jgi:glutamate--cysteine ligase
MSAPESESERPIRGLDDLLQPFYEAEKPRARWRVGAEAEKFGVLRAGEDGGDEDFRPLPFEGPRSVQWIFEQLVQRHGWFEEREYEGGPVVALRRGSSSITLEPGAQFELSGAPQETIHQICAEFRGHMAELRDVAYDAGIRWIGLGFHPFARRDELPLVPKQRYSIMRDYMPTRGALGLDMMTRTATVQANYDFDSEQDAMRKLRVGLRLQPVVTALFANSPWIEGRATGERSHRARVWLDVDPDRSGLLPFAWEDSMSYRRYVQWALDVPMYLIKRNGRVIQNTQQTFRTFMNEGRDGHHATLSDWEVHLNTLFPEVRLKRTIEVRGADGQGTQLTCALPALWKGIFYDAQALAKAEQLAEQISYAEAERAREDITQRALRARLAGREVGEWASELVGIACGGLGRISNLSTRGNDECVHLARLYELTRAAKSPADILLERVHEGVDFREQVLDEARVV